MVTCPVVCNTQPGSSLASSPRHSRTLFDFGSTTPLSATPSVSPPGTGQSLGAGRGDTRALPRPHESDPRVSKCVRAHGDTSPEQATVVADSSDPTNLAAYAYITRASSSRSREGEGSNCGGGVSDATTRIDTAVVCVLQALRAMATPQYRSLIRANALDQTSRRVALQAQE